MSTKIYNGFKFKKTMSIMELNAFVADLRTEMVKIANEEYIKLLARQLEVLNTYIFTGVHIRDAISGIDYSKFDVEGNSNAVFWLGMQLFDVMRKNEKADNIVDHCSEADFTFKISILPIRGKLLGLFYSDNSRLSKYFCSRPEIEEYEYWNNTDMPDNMTKARWETRKKDWDKALPSCGIPADNGFSYDVVRDFHIQTYICEKEKLMPYFRPSEVVLREAAKSKLLDVIFNKLQAERGKDECPWGIIIDAEEHIRNNPQEIDAMVETLSIQDIKTLFRKQD